MLQNIQILLAIMHAFLSSCLKGALIRSVTERDDALWDCFFAIIPNPSEEGQKHA
ncbi:hypothetical protein APA386B_1375 [Acetobacter pasteurianus 386B]|nr:hypothetical protein APA386B_1375 [Acetobacter pasteurianus 386B]